MKRICIVNLNVYCLFVPESGAPMGGAELDMYTIAKGLQNRYDVSIITGDWGQRELESFDRIRIIRSFKLGGRGWCRFFRGIFLFWKSLLRADADIYISSGAGPEIGIMAFFCKIRKRKFLYRTASIIDCNKEYIHSNGIRGLAYWYGLENAHRIVTTVREHQEALIHSHPGLRNRISHINLGIFMEDRRGQMKEGILWVGRCDALKNPEVLLEMAASLPQYLFVMICPRQNHNVEYFDSIKKQAESLENVSFFDFVPFKDIQPYFDKAKLFINTSDFEGFTYTLIQSGLAGTPVVYLNVNPDNLITERNIGYVAGGDTEKMISQMRALLDDVVNWQEKSENVYKYTKENHDINILSDQWDDLVKNL